MSQRQQGKSQFRYGEASSPVCLVQICRVMTITKEKILALFCMRLRASTAVPSDSGAAGNEMTTPLEGQGIAVGQKLLPVGGVPMQVAGELVEYNLRELWVIINRNHVCKGHNTLCQLNE